MSHDEQRHSDGAGMAQAGESKEKHRRKPTPRPMLGLQTRSEGKKHQQSAQKHLPSRSPSHRLDIHWMDGEEHCRRRRGDEAAARRERCVLRKQPHPQVQNHQRRADMQEKIRQVETGRLAPPQGLVGREREVKNRVPGTAGIQSAADAPEHVPGERAGRRLDDEKLVIPVDEAVVQDRAHGDEGGEQDKRRRERPEPV